MPAYEYQCRDCGHAFEIFATFKQKEAGLQPECPECHSMETRQVYSMMFIRSGASGSAMPMPMGCGPNMGPGCC